MRRIDNQRHPGHPPGDASQQGGNRSMDVQHVETLITA